MKAWRRPTLGGGSGVDSDKAGGHGVTVAKAKDQEELDKQANLVYGFVSNFFSSYKHISENQVLKDIYYSCLLP